MLRDSAPADRCYAGPGDVACDSCKARKRKASKSCLQCLVSYCEQHLQPHYESPAFKRHKLVDPSKKLQENICTRHNEVMKIFCRTDQRCICYLCSMGEHKGHNTVSAAAEWTKRQKELGVGRKKIQQRIQDREKDVGVLQQEVEAINRSADKAVRDSEKMSTKLVRLIEKRSSGVKSKIRSQQESEAGRATELQRKLERELAELRGRDADLEKLSHTDDQIQFLNNSVSLSRPIKFTIFRKINSGPLRYFEDATAAVSEAADKLKDSCGKEWEKILMTVTEVDVLLPQDPKTKAELSQYAVHKNHFQLDPNTANGQVVLSEENRKAASVNHHQFPSSHPDRSRSQVLSRKGLTGRCYWEVQWSGLGVSVAVAYKDIARTGDDSVFGNNDKSWSVLSGFHGGEEVNT
ncbi:tripartite motif-containing protein 16-like [Enoplosus armatus]|uniref:tripartite motif-containing protein 16-like n=1 Tax=Enoplosus armatus TaxID=215367 RepID=UPI003992DF81